MPKLDEMEKFSKYIMSLVDRDKIGYIDAITEYCEESGLEVELAAKLVTPRLLSKIAEEARESNLIERYPVLPI